MCQDGFTVVDSRIFSCAAFGPQIDGVARWPLRGGFFVAAHILNLAVFSKFLRKTVIRWESLVGPLFEPDLATKEPKRDAGQGSVRTCSVFAQVKAVAAQLSLQTWNISFSTGTSYRLLR